MDRSILPRIAAYKISRSIGLIANRPGYSLIGYGDGTY